MKVKCSYHTELPSLHLMGDLCHSCLVEGQHRRAQAAQDVSGGNW